MDMEGTRLIDGGIGVNGHSAREVVMVECKRGQERV